MGNFSGSVKVVVLWSFKSKVKHAMGDLSSHLNVLEHLFAPDICWSFMWCARPLQMSPDFNLLKRVVATPTQQLVHYHNLQRKWKCGISKCSTPWPPATSHSLLLFAHKEELSASIRQRNQTTEKRPASPPWSTTSEPIWKTNPFISSVWLNKVK